MKKLFGTLLMLTLVTFLLAPEAFAQRGGQEGAKNKQSQRGKRGRRGMRNGRGSRIDDAPKVGDFAPTFSLKSMDGESETNLADFKGDKPVVLFFGSYT